MSSVSTNDRINKVSLGSFDQAVVLTQYLINNGIDNLWLQDANSDNPATTAFTYESAVGILNNVALSSPRIILQPTPSGGSGSNVIFQLRVEKGTFMYRRPGQQSSWISCDMKGWKIGYRTVMVPKPLSTSSSDYQTISAKLPFNSTNTTTISSLTPQLSTSDDYYASPAMEYSSFSTLTDADLAQSEFKQGFAAVWSNKLQELKAKNLLLGGYSINSTNVDSSQHPPTFVPTSTVLQNYPWTGPAPLSQPTYGLQGNARMNCMCFLGTTNNNPLPSPPAIPVNGNWTTTTPPTLATSRPLPRDGWTVVADSSQPGNEASRVLDGDTNSIWHTSYFPSVTPLPHSITIDMKQSNLISGFTYLPRQDGGLNGTIGRYRLESSNTDSAYATITTGQWNNDASLKQVLFAPILARFVKLTALGESQTSANPWTSASEINILSNGLDRAKYTRTVDSFEQGFDAGKLTDGNINSYWHTQYNGQAPAHPHWIQLQDPQGGNNIGLVSGISYLPRQDGSANGRIGSFKVQASYGEGKWFDVVSGSWPDDASPKTVAFSPINVPWIRLMALSEAGNRGPWTSAAEINLLDASGQVANQSSSDFGTFAMSRNNFFERYLLPKLRRFNTAFEARADEPSMTVKDHHVSVDFSWTSSGLGVGTIDNGEPRFNFAKSSANEWIFNGDPRFNYDTKKDASGGTAKMTSKLNCMTVNRVIMTPGSSRIVVSGTSSFTIEVVLDPGTLSSDKKDKMTYVYSWTINLDLQSVSDGGLAINMSGIQPTITTSFLKNGKSTSSGNLFILKGFDDYLRQCFEAATTQFGQLKKQLQEDIGGQEKLYFPASGTYFFKDPVINANGDLLCSISYNGVDDGNPNANAPPRQNIVPEVPQTVRVAPPTGTA